MSAKSETQVMQPQAKECLESPDARRGKQGFSPRGSEGNTGLLTPELERVNFCDVKPPQFEVIVLSANRYPGSCSRGRREQCRVQPSDLHGPVCASAWRQLLCIHQGRNQFLRCLKDHIEEALCSLDLAQFNSYNIFYHLIQVGL